MNSKKEMQILNCGKFEGSTHTVNLQSCSLGLRKQLLGGKRSNVNFFYHHCKMLENIPPFRFINCIMIFAPQGSWAWYDRRQAGDIIWPVILLTTCTVPCTSYFSDENGERKKFEELIHKLQWLSSLTGVHFVMTPHTKQTKMCGTI